MSLIPSIQALARRLVALEAARVSVEDGQGVAAVRVCEKLRCPLSKLAGVAGFRSLMARALVLTKAESPGLGCVQVRPNGSLEGVIRDNDAGIGIVAQLLGLLVTFIGEPLTLRLVEDAWPEALGIGTDSGSGDRR